MEFILHHTETLLKQASTNTMLIEIHDNKIWSNESPNIYFNISVKRISKPVNVQYICLQCYNGNY